MLIGSRRSRDVWRCECAESMRPQPQEPFYILDRMKYAHKFSLHYVEFWLYRSFIIWIFCYPLDNELKLIDGLVQKKTTPVR